MVDVREAAALTHRTPETIRRWVWTGRLTAVKSGNKLFVRRSDLTWGGAVVEDRPVTLKDWAEAAPVRGGATERGRGGTASDLVLEDRDARAGR